MRCIAPCLLHQRSNIGPSALSCAACLARSPLPCCTNIGPSALSCAPSHIACSANAQTSCAALHLGNAQISDARPFRALLRTFSLGCCFNAQIIRIRCNRFPTQSCFGVRAVARTTDETPASCNPLGSFLALVCARSTKTWPVLFHTCI